MLRKSVRVSKGVYALTECKVAFRILGLTMRSKSMDYHDKCLLHSCRSSLYMVVDGRVVRTSCE